VALCIQEIAQMRYQVSEGGLWGVPIFKDKKIILLLPLILFPLFVIIITVTIMC
jgi:hypothetical protein